MINEKSIDTIKKATFSEKFCRPVYDSYCFSKIPETIKKLFTIDTTEALPPDTYREGLYDHVILLFLDGFGWTFFEKFKSKIATLQKLETNGIVSQLTSMFPSTTAAHVTCINSGLTPCESGLYEWFIYEPKLDEIIAPLPFSIAGERKVDSLPLDPKEILPCNTLYQALSEHGIKSYAFQPASIAHSSYSSCLLSGADVISYHSPDQAFEQLLSRLNQKSYSYFYYSDIDSAGHRKGTRANEFKEAIEIVFASIETLLTKLPSKTALIIIADHGMTDVDPKTTYYLNRKVPNIEKHLQFNAKERPLAPAGSCRDFFLHVRPESLNELREILTHFLEGKAEVYLTEEFIEKQFFGTKIPTQNFLNRVGNLVILPYKGESVWWYEKGHFEQNFYAAHGGLTREEMEIPFIFYS